MIEFQIPQKYKFDMQELFDMIDNTLGVIYKKSLDSKNVLTIDANLTLAQKQALKTNFLTMATIYTDLTM